MVRGKLSPKQTVFINEYAKSLNATQSAIRAGYSENSARVQGHRLLNNPLVKEKVDEVMRIRAEESAVDTDLILLELKEMALSSKVLPKDRLKALDLLGRYKGMWSGDNTSNIPTNIKVTLKGK